MHPLCNLVSETLTAVQERSSSDQSLWAPAKVKPPCQHAQPPANHTVPLSMQTIHWQVVRAGNQAFPLIGTCLMHENASLQAFWGGWPTWAPRTPACRSQSLSSSAFFSTSQNLALSLPEPSLPWARSSSRQLLLGNDLSCRS